MRKNTSVCAVLTVLAAAACGDNKQAPVDSVPADALPADACIPPNLKLQGVTSGDLTIDPTQREVFLDMAPPLDKSILFFSVRENESSPRYGAVECELVAANTTAATPAGLRCRHESFGSDNLPATNIFVHWTVATFDAGVTVQRGVTDTSTTNPLTATLSPAVDPGSSFVIVGGTMAGGGGWGNNDFSRVTLTSGSVLTIEQAAAGSVVPWQVVTMAGARVQRGTSSLTTVETTKSIPVANVAPDSFVLATYTMDNPSSITAGSLMLQATLTPSGFELKRDLGGAAVQVGYEIVSLPFPARQFTTDFAAAETSKSQAVPGLSAKSVAFSTSQGTLGQSSGRTAYADAVELDRLGEAAFTLTATAGMVKVERSASTSTASVTWNVIDLATPSCQ